MKNPKHPLLLAIDYDPNQLLPWAVENARYVLDNEQRAETRDELLTIIDKHLKRLERQVSETIPPNARKRLRRLS